MGDNNCGNLLSRVLTLMYDVMILRNNYAVFIKDRLKATNLFPHNISLTFLFSYTIHGFIQVYTF